jgi:hypothetical protein
MNQGVQMHDSINTVEDLMKVYTKQLDKATVFDNFKNQYTTFFQQNDEFEKQRQGVATVLI